MRLPKRNYSSKTNETYKSNMSYRSGSNLSYQSTPHGGYRNLKSYQTTTIIYDLTVEFCNRYMTYKSNKSYRTYDQMVQAARPARRLRPTSRVRIVPKRRVVSLGGSGRHPIEHFLSPEGYVLASQERVYGARNIAEGSQASAVSKKTEIKLVGVARASLEELLNDYQDFLRQRRLRLWSKDDPKAKAVRALAYESNRSNETYSSYLRSPEDFANCLICLIHQANYLLDQQLTSLEKTFIEEGGYTENLFKRRIANKRSGG